MSSNDAYSDMRFRNKLIIITGAGGNFGRSGCLYFSARGANIAALDNNETALFETIAKVRGTPGRAGRIQGYPCDVTNIESVTKVINDIAKDFGNIDLLWNNAGYQGQIKPTLEYDPADFGRVMDINVTGMFIVLQTVAKQMSKQKVTGDKNGESSHPFAIVNTASVAALRGTPAMVAYASSKAAILAMTVSTAKVCARSFSTLLCVRLLFFLGSQSFFLQIGIIWMNYRILHHTELE